MHTTWTRPLCGLVITWCAGLASAWNVLDGILETITLICGVLIGALTVMRLLRDLGWIRMNRCPSDPPSPGDAEPDQAN